MNSSITIEEEIEYISNFCGYDKAYALRGLTCFLTYKEYLYHKECLMMFINHHNN